MHRLTYVLGVGLLLASAVSAEDTSFMKGKRFAVGDYTGGKVCVVEADGSISWESGWRACVRCIVLQPCCWFRHWA